MWKVVYNYNHIVFFTFIKVEQEKIYYNLDAKYPKSYRQNTNSYNGWLNLYLYKRQQKNFEVLTFMEILVQGYF